MRPNPNGETVANTLERCELLLKAAHALHSNGQETEETLRSVRQLSQQLYVSSELFLSWDAVTLQTNDAAGKHLVLLTRAVPSSVTMNRVEAVNLAIDGVRKQPLDLSAPLRAIEAAQDTSPAQLWMFVLACAAGATALALIFGAVHNEAIAMIAASSALGALLRRGVGHFGAGAIVQALFASFLAGLVGAVAVKLHVSSELRLVALCPCMILVPGPHILNGVLDLTYIRISLGTSRLLFAGLILIAICTAVLLGLQLGGSDLPVDAVGRHVTLWIDVLAAGIAAASYSVYFSTPITMLIWPVLIGMVAHGMRWWVMANFGLGPASAAGIACLVVAILLVPVSIRRKLPFAAIGFASVVSLMPGIFIFRTSSGLVALYQHISSVSPDVLAKTLADATTAIAIVLCMGFGLVVPKRIYGAFARAFTEKESRIG